jgi:hypothetical protein
MSPLEVNAAAGGIGSAARNSPANDRYATVNLGHRIPDLGWFLPVKCATGSPWSRHSV